MKLQVQLDFDLFTLFVHDKGGPPVVDDSWLADQLTKFAEPFLTEQSLRFRATSDSGLDRWTVQYSESFCHNTHDLPYLPEDRPNSVPQVKRMLPPFVCDIIAQLNKTYKEITANG